MANVGKWRISKDRFDNRWAIRAPGSACASFVADSFDDAIGALPFVQRVHTKQKRLETAPHA